MNTQETDKEMSKIGYTIVLELDNKELDACNNPEHNNKPASHS